MLSFMSLYHFHLVWVPLTYLLPCEPIMSQVVEVTAAVGWPHVLNKKKKAAFI